MLEHRILEVRVTVRPRVGGLGEVEAHHVPHDTTPTAVRAKLCQNQGDAPVGKGDTPKQVFGDLMHVGTSAGPVHIDCRGMRMEYRVPPIAHAMAVADVVCGSECLELVQVVEHGRVEDDEVFYFILRPPKRAD